MDTQVGFEHYSSMPPRNLLSSIEDETARGADAIVEISKLREYCLDPDHPRGRHKARVFLSVLGLKQSDAGFLRAALQEAGVTRDAIPCESDDYGDRYTVDFEMNHAGRVAIVRSAWIVLHSESAPRLTSCFVLLD